jgi:hypothetical protein
MTPPGGQRGACIDRHHGRPVSIPELAEVGVHALVVLLPGHDGAYSARSMTGTGTGGVRGPRRCHRLPAMSSNTATRP